jgi:hypothetical protein
MDRPAQPLSPAPASMLAAITPRSFRWIDLKGLVPRNETDRTVEQERICTAVRTRFANLVQLDADEGVLLADQTSHREVALFARLADEAREMRMLLG